MPEITESHGRTEFIHLGICSDGADLFGTVNTEVFKIIYLFTDGIITVADTAALDSIEDLGGMERET